MIKEDLIYRILSHNDNMAKLHNKVTLFQWVGETDEIDTIALSEYTSQFLVHKTRFDIQEMNRLARIMLLNPNADTKFYRQEMGYTNRQLRTIQGYLAELNGAGRNSYYVDKKE